MAFFHGMLLLCLSILCIGGYAVFIEPEERKLRDSEEKLTERKAVEIQLDKDVLATQTQIDKLKTTSKDGALAVEHVARGTLGYCKPTEEIYIFNTVKPDSAKTASDTPATQAPR